MLKEASYREERGLSPEGPAGETMNDTCDPGPARVGVGGSVLKPSFLLSSCLGKGLTSSPG